MLDVGCGSGILAVASLLLGAKSAIGIDIDELAVKSSIENAERMVFLIDIQLFTAIWLMK